MKSDTPLRDQADKPWWRYRIVWLVVGGPLAVVAASLVTAFIAWHGADEVLVETPSARHVVAGRPDAYTPALAARNHAQTPADH